MATKIQQILESNPDTKILFGEWLSRQGLDAKSQYAYMKSGWLSRLSIRLRRQRVACFIAGKSNAGVP